MNPITVGRRRLPVAALLLAAACAGGDRPGPPRFGGEADLWRRILAAEDGRTASPAATLALEDGLRSADPELRRWAVRALGRMEQEALLPPVLTLLADLSAAVRAEAANAAGQAVSRGDPAPARAALVDRLSREADPAVRGAIAETLGWLRHASPDEVRATASLLAVLAETEPTDTAPDAAAGAGTVRVEPTAETWLGVAKGLYFLVRQAAARDSVPADAVTRLRGLATYRVAGADDATAVTAARVRRVATAALAAAAALTAEDVSGQLGDEDMLVRREAAAGTARIADPAAAAPLVSRALADSSPLVRLEGVRLVARGSGAGPDCARLLEATRDPDGHVALLAIDGAGAACTRQPSAVARLDSVAASLGDGAPEGGSWHRAAHALVSLARLEPARARAALPAFAEHANPFVRTWAARAARSLGDLERLRAFADDAAPNVRTAAVEALDSLAGHAADAVYIVQLGEDDSQLLQAAAAALEGSPDPVALPAVLRALERVSGARRETWRDSRAALLRRIRELGDAGSADRIRPLVADYDPDIAGLAADILGDWTGVRPEPDPRPLPRLELPELDSLEALDSAEVVMEMADGGIIRLRLLPFEAPTNAWRFARLARAGWFDGLTFHRVVPNFVIQGGSPAANEYSGDGPYTRDELGRIGNWRGTLGLSTRGRDTGDAQIYVNLIDNTRLDHDYTILAEIVAGMDVVDRILEGAVIRTVTVIVRRTAGA